MPPPGAPETARRVALYGGSFDPPHLAHVMVATWALASQRFDEVRLVPVGGHAFGKPLSPFETRCSMTQAAVAHLGDRVIVDPIEGQLTSPTYTIDTVRAILQHEPGLALSWIVGSDAFASRRAWKQWDTLESLIDFVVVGRIGHPDPEGCPAIPTRFPELSSTEVRRRVAAGEPIATMVPPAVEAIIDAEGLYR